ncbi:MAG: hypothetical protein RLZ98_2968 [Pseudomonadota bacterium]|jgi:peptidylprolyl isomerase
MSEAKQGDTVRIHYTGTFNDGTEFDSSAGRDPLEFEIGAGRIIPGLEREIVGMQVGDTKTVNVAAADAYGPHHPEGVQDVPLSDLPPNLDLSKGARLEAQSQEGERMLLTVVGLTDETVTLDANHPLAGKDLTFQVELVEIC